MKINKRALQWLVTAGLVQQAEASTFQRCVGQTGQLTFTHTSCPDGKPGSPHRAYNPPPGSVAPRVAAPPPSRASSEAVIAPSPPPRAEPVAAAERTKQPRKSKPRKYTPWRQ